MKIFINGVELKFRKKVNNIMIYFLKNDEKLKTKEIKFYTVICDKCGSETKLKIFPTGSKNEYLCSSCRNTGEKNPMFGKKWTEDMRQIRSYQYLGSNNPMYGKSIYDVWLNKYGRDIANEKIKEHANKSSFNSKGEKNPMFGKTFYQQWIKLYGKEIAEEKLKNHCEEKSEWLRSHQEQLKKMIINSHKKPYRKTKIEKIVENFLMKNNIKFKYNFILDKYQYDFLLLDLNVIIEVQGDYWHANPLYYSDTDPNLRRLNDIQKYKVSMDIIKNDFIKDKYEIIYLWETELKNKKFEKLWNLLK